MTAFIFQSVSQRAHTATTEKVEYDTSSQPTASDSCGRMNAEAAKGTESVGFRYPALVSLAPKRRFKITAPATEKDEQDFEETKPIRFGLHDRPRLKRSGRMIFRWPGTDATAIRVAL